MSRRGWIVTTAFVIPRTGASAQPLLNAGDEELVEKLAKLERRDDVAELLEIPAAFLKTLLYGIEERKRYRCFKIPKRGGSVTPGRTAAPQWLSPKERAALHHAGAHAAIT